MDKPMNDNQQQGGLDGLSTLDFSALAPAERFIVRFILRKLEASYTQINEAAGDLPTEKRLSQQELDDSLADLTERGWLLRREEGDQSWYKVHFRTRATRKAEDSPLQDAWDSLADGDTAQRSPTPAEKPGVKPPASRRDPLARTWESEPDTADDDVPPENSEPRSHLGNILGALGFGNKSATSPDDPEATP